MTVDGAQPAADQDEGALGETGICLSAVLFFSVPWMSWFQGNNCSYEYAAGIQFASPGPTSRPSFLLNASPPASVTKFAAYLHVVSINAVSDCHTRTYLCEAGQNDERGDQGPPGLLQRGRRLDIKDSWRRSTTSGYLVDEVRRKDSVRSSKGGRRWPGEIGQRDGLYLSDCRPHGACC